MATPQELIRPTRLSREQIVAAAVDLAGNRGLEALSIRSIAALLGVSPMALYRHVATKEEIVDLVVDHMLSQESAHGNWPRNWEDILRILARRLRELFLHHPVVLETMQRRAVAGPHTLDGIERLIAALTQEGLDVPAATAIYGNTLAFVFGHTALQLGRERARRASGRSEDGDLGRLTHQIAQLPSSDYPNVVAASSEIPRLFDDEHFEAGLERLVRSVAAELPAHPHRRRRF